MMQRLKLRFDVAEYLKDKKSMTAKKIHLRFACTPQMAAVLLKEFGWRIESTRKNRNKRRWIKE